jgi:hypothetical protein
VVEEVSSNLFMNAPETSLLRDLFRRAANLLTSPSGSLSEIQPKLGHCHN